MMSKTFVSILLASMIIVGVLTTTVDAHPFHVCVGQMKWNATSKAWEVSVRLDPRDLEMAMMMELRSKQSAVEISISDENFPELATRFLNRHFYIRRTPRAITAEELVAKLKQENTTSSEDATKAKSTNAETDEKSTKPEDRSSITWLGKEPEKGWLWIYFEMSQPEFDPAQHKLWLAHELLLESVENQENSILIEPTTTPRYSLQFRLGSAIKELTL